MTVNPLINDTNNNVFTFQNEKNYNFPSPSTHDFQFNFSLSCYTIQYVIVSSCAIRLSGV